MLAAGVSAVCREMRVALPATGGDVYRQHQLVWEAMRATARHGQDFTYAMLSPHVALVRSERLARGQSCELREGRMRVLLATARQTDHGLVALVPSEVPAMVEALLARHGIAAADVEIHEQSTLQGAKRDRETQRQHDIRVPVTDLSFTARFTNRALAARALQHGIGRAKRFGCGMLRPTS